MTVRVRAGVRGVEGTYRDLDLAVEQRFRWLVLPSVVCGELGIDTPGVERVVAPSDETVCCEFGIALIETEGRQGATLVYKFDTEPKIGNIALGSLGIKIDKQTGELVIDAPRPLVRGFRPG